jgi:CRISPR/Cas system Type II protein with McrA/HNH and RuvC-like nuclease domain
MREHFYERSKETIEEGLEFISNHKGDE